VRSACWLNPPGHDAFAGAAVGVEDADGEALDDVGAGDDGGADDDEAVGTADVVDAVGAGDDVQAASSSAIAADAAAVRPALPRVMRRGCHDSAREPRMSRTLSPHPRPSGAGMSFRVIADYDRCKSHGRCMAAAPEVFEVRDDGYMYILLETIDESLRGACEDAVDACPEQAIRIEG
jgi:ferredoxin